MARTRTNILTKEQIGFLDLVAAEPYFRKHFYLTGGTALAAFYLGHRFSEDIDLFSEEEVNIAAVSAFMRKAQKRLDASKVDYRQYLGLHIFELIFSEHTTLKVDFNYYPFPRIEKGVKYSNLPVDSILDIAVNKVQTIATQPRARDFIDLFFILREKKFSLQSLFMHAKAKFDWPIDPLQLGSRLYLAREVTDFPRMIQQIDHKEWQKFFIHEASKLKKDILS